MISRENNLREKFCNYILEEYGQKEDFPFEKYPDISVFRHNENRKWFAILMQVSADKFGKNKKDKVWTVGLKCDTFLKESFLKEKGVYPSYHMNKDHWISVILSEVEDSLLKTLIDISFDLTQKKYKKKKAA